MMASPVVLVPPFFLEALLGALLFFAFAIVDVGLFSLPPSPVALLLLLVSSVFDESVLPPAISSNGAGRMFNSLTAIAGHDRQLFDKLLW